MLVKKKKTAVPWTLLTVVWSIHLSFRERVVSVLLIFLLQEFSTTIWTSSTHTVAVNRVRARNVRLSISCCGVVYTTSGTFVLAWISKPSSSLHPSSFNFCNRRERERESVVCTFNLVLGLYSRVGKSHFIYLLFFLFFFSSSLLGVLFTSTLSWSNRMFYFVLVPEKLLVLSSIIFINPHLPHFASIPVFPFHSWILIVPCMESNLLISHSLGGLAAGSVDLTSIVFFSFSSSSSLFLFFSSWCSIYYYSFLV